MRKQAPNAEGEPGRIYIFKLGHRWYFKQFFDDPQLFEALSKYYIRERFRFELTTVAERDEAMKYLKANGYDPVIIEDTCGVR